MRKRKWVSIVMSGVIILNMISGLSVGTLAKNDPSWKYGIGDSLGFNEETYRSIKPYPTGEDNQSWRYGSMSANGEIAFIESCDPDEDVFIFNNTKIVTDSNNYYETPDIRNALEDQKKAAVERSSGGITWLQAADQYAQETYGDNWGTTWTRAYQPAAQYRIKNNEYQSGDIVSYNRYTNFETAEVGTQWMDKTGKQWNRRTFSSRADGMIVTLIEADENLDITISMDHIYQMAADGTTWNSPDTDFILEQEEDGYSIGMVGKYLTEKVRGTNPDNPYTKFSFGGWASATRVIVPDDAAVQISNNNRTVTIPSTFAGVGNFTTAKDPKITISGTNYVMLLTKVDLLEGDHTNPDAPESCRTTGEVKTKLFDKLIDEIKDVIDTQTTKAEEASYQKLLNPHKQLHGEMFDTVRLDICSTPEEITDRKLTNQQLINKQNSDKSAINNTFLERIYNNGRFGLICASGYQTSRLGGIWGGAWQPAWSGDFTLDANVNLQVSGMNTGNMEGVTLGYINFILRMVSKWEEDAERVYDMKNAIKAPPRVDGTGDAGSYHFLYDFPHIYGNSITDWMLIPLFEYWQCYGNRKVPVGENVDLQEIKGVLDLTESDLKRIEAEGFDFVSDILSPMLLKTMNFWLQFVDENYYSEGDGTLHVNDGTTLFQALSKGDEGARYLFTPGYSPENWPGGTKGNLSLAFNTTMDISAAHDTLFMARAILDEINPSNKTNILEEWAEFESLIPEYIYESTGELKEYAHSSLRENHEHRHESHAYGAWPGYEAQDDLEIREGIAVALDKRSEAFGGSEAPESHGAMHKALVEARLKRESGFERALRYLLTSNYQYPSYMTSHDNDRNWRSFCTDSAFGIFGAVNESLLFSNTGVIEILPTLLSTVDKGSVTGLRTRAKTVANEIKWDRKEKTASVTLTYEKGLDGDGVNVIKLMNGLSWESASVNGRKQPVKTDELGRSYIELALSDSQSVTVDFELAAAPTVNPYERVEAEEYTRQFGIQVEDCRDNEDIEPGKNIGYIEDGDWVMYANVDFGVEGAKNFFVRAGSIHSNVNIDIMVDDIDSAPIGTVSVENTEAWHSYHTLVSEVSNVTGIHDVYLKFSGGVNVNWWKFEEADPEPEVVRVKELIDKIGTVTLSSERAIEKAWEAYQELTDAQKKKVTNYNKLTDAKERYQILKDEEERRKENEAADKKAVLHVESLIDAIGSITYDATTERKIGEARAAYDKLTSKQKAMVGNYDVLKSAESKYDTLKTKTVRVPQKGSIHKKKNLKYKVVKSAKKNGTVMVYRPVKKTLKSVVIPPVVKLNGYTFKVTGISSKAFMNNRKLQKVTIGKNVKKVGTKAFYGAKKLRHVTIKSKTLKTVGRQAFSKTSSKMVIKVPKSKVVKYKRILKVKKVSI